MKRIVIFIFIFCIACSQKVVDKHELINPPVEIKTIE